MLFQSGRAIAPARAIALIAVLLISAGCATTPGATGNDDPWEGMNRGIHTLNTTVDRVTLRPIAKGYKKITPRWFRTGVGNFFANLSYPTTIVNQFLQGKPKQGLRDTGRFLMNTTIGVGGLLDVATSAGLQASDEDFGQTLAVWGVGSGPFVMLPFFGPSSLRDAPSRVFDYFLGPLVYLEVPWETKWALRGLNITHDRAELLSLDPVLAKAYDPYAFIREAWVQQRTFAIWDGNPPPEKFEEDFGDEDDVTEPEAPAATPEEEPAPEENTP